MISPAFVHKRESDYLPGERLTVRLVQESRGRLIALRPRRSPFAFDPGKVAPPDAREIARIVEGMESMLSPREQGWYLEAGREGPGAGDVPGLR